MYGPAFVALHIPFPSWIRTLLPIISIGRYLSAFIPTVVIGWYLLAKDSNLSQEQLTLILNIQPQVDQLTQNQCKRSSWECRPIHLHPTSWCAPTQLHHYTAPWQQKLLGSLLLNLQHTVIKYMMNCTWLFIWCVWAVVAGGGRTWGPLHCIAEAAPALVSGCVNIFSRIGYLILWHVISSWYTKAIVFIKLVPVLSCVFRSQIHCEKHILKELVPDSFNCPELAHTM